MKDKCCENCNYFKDEDADGFGQCNRRQFRYRPYRDNDACEHYEILNGGWTEITPDNVDGLYNIPEDLLIVAFKLGDTIYYKRNKDMKPTLKDIAKVGGYYYFVLPELKIDNEQAGTNQAI